MRWYVLALVVLASLSVAYAEGEWGCCIPDFGECFDGTAFADEPSFENACTAASGTVEGEGEFTTCNTFEAAGGVCELGCCCAGEDVFDSPSINSDEDLLRTTRISCDAKQGGTWNFSYLPSGGSCVDICGGTVAPPQEGGNHTISGVVRNASGGNPMQDVVVFIPVPGGDISTASDDEGRWTLTQVPEQTARVYAVHPACRPGQSSPIIVDRDVANVTVLLDCNLAACVHAEPEIEGIDLVQGTDRAQLTAAVDDACEDFIQYEPLRCDANFDRCIGLPPSTSSAILDENLLNSTTYCYKVRARFSDGNITESAEDADSCITTGAQQCMQRSESDPNPWCGRDPGSTGTAILSCDEENNLDVSACGGGTFCSPRSGQPECIEAPECTLCNGLAGLFASLPFEISVPPYTRLCSEILSCFPDSSLEEKPLMVDAYSSCLSTAECSQYRSQGACGQDACGLGGCEWRWVAEELGQGICSPRAGDPPCEQCSDILGYCSKDACEAISPQCYYDLEHNGLEAQGCLPKSKMACRYYDTKEDCTGQGGNAAFDIGGTNARTSPSADRLGIGACTWIASEDRCVKNADMELSSLKEDDCIESGYYYVNERCVIDATPPETEFFLSEVPVYARIDVRTLPYRVSDDLSPLEKIETLVCFTQSDPCYPEETLGQIGLPGQGNYTLYYYSVDASENHETVKSAQIVIKDTGEPGIEEIRIEER